MPYGLGVAPWDVLLSDAELEIFFQQLAVTNRARSHCLVLGVVWHDSGRVRKFMGDNGYLDIHPIYPVKPQQNTTGMEWIFAVEMLVAGYKGGIRSCNLTFSDMNPVFRHNFFFVHQVGAKLKHTGEEADVNTTQKNPNVASMIGRITCKPGSYALVIGAGSGSEVVGIARVGVNVVALERDAKQFRALTERLTTEASFSARAIKQQGEEEKQVALLTMLAAKFTKLNPVLGVHFADADKDQLGEKAEDGAEQSLSLSPVQGRSCPSCGQELKQTDEIECAKSKCTTGKLHATCALQCQKCAKFFCSSGCNEDHGCQA
jgi:hypothetical protein